MIQLILALLISGFAQAGTVGNSCAANSILSAPAACDQFSGTIKVSTMHVSGRIAIFTTTPNYDLDTTGADGFYLGGDGYTGGSLTCVGPNFRVGAENFNIQGSSVAIGSLTPDPNYRFYVNGNSILSKTQNSTLDLTLINGSSGGSAATAIVMENDVADTVTLALPGSGYTDDPALARKLVIEVSDSGVVDPFTVIIGTKALATDKPLCLTSTNQLGVCTINLIAGNCSSCAAP